MVTPSTQSKRDQLVEFVDRMLVKQHAVRAVIAIGSIGAGTAHEASDIDIAIFLDPVDLYLVPAEAIWRPSDDTFHSIFTEDADLQSVGIQLDFQRFDLQRWREPDHEWPEPIRAELAAGWDTFDRDGEVSRLIAAHAAYDDQHRLTQLDDAITWLDQHLDEAEVQQRWRTLGPVVAHDRLQSAYGYLVQGLFAYKRRWRPWRNREMTALLALPWLPARFQETVFEAAIAQGHDKTAYLARASTLRRLLVQLVGQLRESGDYGADPISEAFIRSHEEPGRAWNLDEWNHKHRSRYPS